MKKSKPTSAGRRGMTHINYREVLSGHRPHKKLTVGRAGFAGRNGAGRITVRHQGGGVKKSYRLVDFVYDKKDIPARVETIEYDPFRSGFIARIVYKDGERRYILVPKGVKVGDSFIASKDAPIKPGNRLPLSAMPIGTFIYNIELKLGGGARIARSAGIYGELIARDAGFAQIKMPSTEVRKVVETAWASIGTVSNDEHHLVNIGKAGRSRKMGIRPTVRGTAMNPVDHPHGGGEGRQGRGRRRAVSLWGKPTGKGQKTRRAKKYSNSFIVTRRKVGKRG